MRLTRAQAAGLAMAVAVMSLLIVLSAFYVYRTYVSSYARLSEYKSALEKPDIVVHYDGVVNGLLTFTATNEGPVGTDIQYAYLVPQSSVVAPEAEYPVNLQPTYLGVGNSVTFTLPPDEPTVLLMMSSGVPMEVAFVTQHGTILSELGPLNASLYLTINVPQEFVQLNGEPNPTDLNVTTVCYLSNGPVAFPVFPVITSLGSNGGYDSYLVYGSVPALGDCKVYVSLSGEWPLVGPMGGFEAYSPGSAGVAYGFAAEAVVTESQEVQLSPGDEQSLVVTFPQMLASTPHNLPPSATAVQSAPYVLDFSWYLYPTLVYDVQVNTIMTQLLPYDLYGSTQELAALNQQVFSTGIFHYSSQLGCSFATDAIYAEYGDIGTNSVYPTISTPIAAAWPSGVTLVVTGCPSSAPGSVVYITIPLPPLSSGYWLVVPVFGVVNPHRADLQIGEVVLGSNGQPLASVLPNYDDTSEFAELTMPLFIVGQQAGSGTLRLGLYIDSYKSSNDLSGLAVIISKIVLLPVTKAPFCVISGNYLPYEQVSVSQASVQKSRPYAVINMWPYFYYTVPAYGYPYLVLLNTYGSTYTNLPTTYSATLLMSAQQQYPEVYAPSGTHTLSPANGVYMWGSYLLNGQISISVSAYSNTNDHVNGTVFIVPYYSATSVPQPNWNLIMYWYYNTRINPSPACRPLGYAPTREDEPLPLQYFPFIYGSFLYTGSSSPSSTDASITITINNVPANSVILIPLMFYAGLPSQAAGVYISPSSFPLGVSVSSSSGVVESEVYATYFYLSQYYTVAVNEILALVAQSAQSSVTVTIYPIEAFENLGLPTPCSYSVDVEGIIISPNYTTNQIIGPVATVNNKPLAVGLNIMSTPLPGYSSVIAEVFTQGYAGPIINATLPGGSGLLSFLNLIPGLSSVTSVPNVIPPTSLMSLDTSYYAWLFPSAITEPYTLVLIDAWCPSSYQAT